MMRYLTPELYVEINRADDEKIGPSGFIVGWQQFATFSPSAAPLETVRDAGGTKIPLRVLWCPVSRFIRLKRAARAWPAIRVDFLRYGDGVQGCWEADWSAWYHDRARRNGARLCGDAT